MHINTCQYIVGRDSTPVRMDFCFNSYNLHRHIYMDWFIIRIYCNTQAYCRMVCTITYYLVLNWKQNLGIYVTQQIRREFQNTQLHHMNVNIILS